MSLYDYLSPIWGRESQNNYSPAVVHIERLSLCVSRIFRHCAKILPSGSSWRRCGSSGSTLCSSDSSAVRRQTSTGLWSPQSASQPRWTCRWWSEASRPPGQSQSSAASLPRLPAWSTGRALQPLPQTGSSAAGLSLENKGQFGRNLLTNLLFLQTVVGFAGTFF